MSSITRHISGASYPVEVDCKRALDEADAALETAKVRNQISHKAMFAFVPGLETFRLWLSS